MSDIQPTEAEKEGAFDSVDVASWDFMSVTELDASFISKRERMKVLIGRRDAQVRADAVKAERTKEAAAFRAAVNAIYFDDSSDYKSALYEVIEALKPGYEPERMPFCETVEDAIAILSDNQEDRNG